MLGRVTFSSFTVPFDLRLRRVLLALFILAMSNCSNKDLPIARAQDAADTPKEQIVLVDLIQTRGQVDNFYAISTASFYKWRQELFQTPDQQRQTFLPDEVLSSEPLDDVPLRVRLAAGAVIEIPPQRTDVLLAVIEKIQTSGPPSRPQLEPLS